MTLDSIRNSCDVLYLYLDCQISFDKYCFSRNIYMSVTMMEKLQRTIFLARYPSWGWCLTNARAIFRESILKSNVVLNIAGKKSSSLKPNYMYVCGEFIWPYAELFVAGECVWELVLLNYILPNFVPHVEIYFALKCVWDLVSQV